MRGCATISFDPPPPPLRPPPAVNSNCIMAGLVAFWIPIGVDARLAEGYTRQDRYTHCVCAPQTRGVSPSYVHMRVTTRTCTCVTHGDPGGGSGLFV